MTTLHRNRLLPTKAAKVLVSGREGVEFTFLRMIFMKKSKPKDVLSEVECSAIAPDFRNQSGQPYRVEESIRHPAKNARARGG
jgi:hypothetical protein